MFAKAYRLKSNNTLKNSEKKHLAQLIQDEFPGVTEEKVKELVPVKSNSSCMKLTLHSGRTVGVYVVDGLPVFIETEQGLAPTVCALWKVPDLVPILIIHTPVLPKMLGGAPLYLPGVCRAAGGGWGAFERGAVVAACTQDNRAACVVGRATLAAREMVHLVAGVCLETIHVYGDLLCKDPKLGKVERPKLGPAAYPGELAPDLAAHFTQLHVQPPLREEWPSLGRPPSSAPTPSAAPAASPSPCPSPAPANLPATIPEVAQQAGDLDTTTQLELEDTMLTESSMMEEDSIPSDMDGLLQWCLLTFLKLEGRRLELPLKNNLLYKNHLMPLCPPGRTLDVRKSSYKKMGKFLEAMQNEGLLEVRELDKGVGAVVAVHPAHPRLRAHALPAAARHPTRDAPPPQSTEYVPPVVQDLYCLTAAVMDLFPDHKKGTAVTSKELRAGVTEYARAHKLVLDTKRDNVIMDDSLARILKTEKTHASWEEVFTAVQARCTASTLLQHADGEQKLIKSRLEPVQMAVVTRSGNKKVTLVSNLEAYGFSLPALAHACQQRAAASCGVTRSPAARCHQLMLQGDQTHFVAKLLIEKYGLPKKYVEGADKALKKKK